MSLLLFNLNLSYPKLAAECLLSNIWSTFGFQNRTLVTTGYHLISCNMCDKCTL